ncbi:phosphonoacetaldehyde hydrolase [Microbaculum marinum]|uniref:Phosphonoacetaldehyde hydrolase n=1 Tax=Microbaculum marinum TaxID=1764581 RepID=A0AAW9RBX5_9HYPH
MTESRLKAVVFDWAGTVVDFGSRAPMGAFVEVFGRFGVDISIEEARGPMGLPKWDHIQALGRNPRIAEAWKAAKGAPFTDADVDAIYEVFVPLNAEVVVDYADLIPGAVETVAALRERGLKIGSTTGYTREIMERLAPLAAEQGFAPDNLVCAGDLSSGRPGALMMYRTFLDLDVWPAWSVVKVDDTDPGIAEGLAAGTWTVGVAASGNAMGLSREEYEALDDDTYLERFAAAESTLLRAGAHFVVGSVEDLLPVIDEIEGRLLRGERP